MNQKPIFALLNLHAMKSSLPEADRHDPVRTGSHTGMINGHARFHPVSFVTGQVMAFEKKL